MSVREYWKTVIVLAWQDAKGMDKVKAFLSAIAVLLLIVACIALGYFTGKFTFEFFRDNVLSVLITAVSTAIYFSALIIVLFAVLIYRTPRELHNKQIDQINVRDNQIKELKDTWEPKQINLQVDAFGDTQKKMVELTIKNPVSQKITHLSVQLHELIYVFPSRRGRLGERVQKSFNRTDPRFREGVFREPDTILPLGEVRIFVSKVEEEVKSNGTEKVVFMLTEPENISIFDSVADNTGRILDVADFEIEFEIDGIADRSPIVTQKVKAHMHYEHGFAQWLQRGDEPAAYIHPTSSILSMEILPNEQKETEQKSKSAPGK